MANPSDPIIESFGWYEMGYDELETAIVVHDGRLKRATAMGMFANEVGCDWSDVRCVVRYVRSLTYQEAWDKSGKDAWIEQWMTEHNVGYYFATHDYRYDSPDDPPGPPAHELRKATLPTPPAIPPADWTPIKDGHYESPFVLVDDPNKSYPTPVHRVFWLDT